MKWLRSRSLLSSPLAIVAAAIALGCVAFPVTLHQLTLVRIRESTFDAIRFAAASPEQLRALPVVGWHEGEKPAAPAVRKTGWEQYQMTLPRGDASTIIDIDLRSTMLPLLLGFGGWLRILVTVMVSGAVAYLLLKWRGLGERMTSDGTPIFKIASAGGGSAFGGSNRAPNSNHDSERTTAMPDNGVTQRQALPQQLMTHLPYAAFLFDTHHQLIHWNEAAQAILPHLILSTGIHMLDLSAHLPWGNEMVEKMDEVAQHPALVIHKGDSLCVIPG